MAAEQEILFTTLSNLVLDELRFPGQKPMIDVVGGPGAYGLSTLVASAVSFSEHHTPSIIEEEADNITSCARSTTVLAITKITIHRLANLHRH